MTTLWVLLGLIVGAVVVSTLGAAFSIFGLAALFSGAAVAVMLMAGALEVSKFFIAAYLHQAWGRLRWAFKAYLLVSVVVLSAITSLGIFGYLSEAYQESSSAYEAETVKLTSLKADQTRLKEEIIRFNRAVDEIPASRVTKKMAARAEADAAITKLNAQIAEIAKQITAGELHILDVKKRVGPLLYISKAFNLDIDTVVKYLIMVFVSVFDPLAICMVIAVSEAFESRRKHKEREQFAATLVATTPVVTPSPGLHVVPPPEEVPTPVFQETAFPEPTAQQMPPLPQQQPQAVEKVAEQPPVAPISQAEQIDQMMKADPKVVNLNPEEDTIEMRFAKDKKVV